MTADNAALVAELDDLIDGVTVTVMAVGREPVPNLTALGELNEARALLVRASNRLNAGVESGRPPREEAIKLAESLPDAIAGALSGFGGYLRCRTCGQSADLGDPGRRVTGGGWPKHCGPTMEWITQSQIDRGERPARESSS